MKKGKKIILTIGIIIAIIIIPNIPFYYNCYTISNEKLPKKFENYKNIYDLKTNKDFEIDAFFDKRNNYPYILSDGTIILYRNSNKGNTSWYKINAKGEITDSLTKKGDNYSYMNGYIIRDDRYYCSWIMDNDTLQKPFLPYKIQDNISKKDFLSLLNNRTEYANFIGTDLKINKHKYIFLKDKKWFYIYSKLYLPTEVDYREDTFPKLIFSEIKSNKNDIYLDYFFKKESTMRNFWDLRNFSYGGSGGGGTSTKYYGTGYYHVKYNGKYLQFSEEQLKMDNDNNINDSSELFTLKNTKYFILCQPFSGSIYIVKPKK